MKINSLNGRFTHFNERLHERYGLQVAIDEWKRIKVASPLYKTSINGLFCTVEIGPFLQIPAIMQVGKEDGYLRTVYPDELPIHHFPRPHVVRKLISQEQFGELVLRDFEIANNIEEMPDKDLFRLFPHHIAYMAKYEKIRQKGHFYEQARFVVSVARAYISGKTALMVSEGSRKCNTRQ